MSRAPRKGICSCEGCFTERHPKSSYCPYHKNEKNKEYYKRKGYRTTRANRYGISIEEVNYWLDNYDCCAICGDKPNTLRMDHNHNTGEIRGMLCDSCNTGIGLLKDDPDIIIKAAEYVKNNGVK